MIISELENKHIKIGKTSITVVNGVEGFESEHKRAEERQTIAENMGQYATVINCYID